MEKIEDVAKYIKENFREYSRELGPWMDEIWFMKETESAILVQSDVCTRPAYETFIFPKDKDEAYYILLGNSFVSQGTLEKGDYELIVRMYTNATYGFYRLAWPFWKDDKSNWNKLDWSKYESEVHANEIEVDGPLILPDEFNSADKLINLACEFFGFKNKEEWLNYEGQHP